MLYNHKTTNVLELQVCAATQMLHTSIDEQIAAAAKVMQLNNIVSLQAEELGRLRNDELSKVAQENQTLVSENARLATENNDLLTQYGTLKQRFESSKTEFNETLLKEREEKAALQAELDALRGTKSAQVRKAPVKNPAKGTKVSQAK